MSEPSSTNGTPRDREEARRDEAARLDGEILAAIGRGWDDPVGELEFDALARDLFAHQFRFNPIYRRLCQLRDVSASADVASWREIPTVPTGAFKVGRWAAFPPEAETAAFETSGTSRDTAGAHRFETLALYNAAIVPAARRFVVPDRDSIRLLLLSPSPADAPRSSLVHMLAVWREVFGAPGSGFFLTGSPETGGIRADLLAEALDRAVADGVPVAVCGAALAHRHALAALGEETWSLPEGSRVMLTGGFKGVRGTADPGALTAAIESRLGVPRAMHVEEYGMTELSSQAYGPGTRSTLLGESSDEESGFVMPPWTRTRVVDPLSGDEVGADEEGVLVHVDLANRGSAVAILTSDQAVSTGPRSFELRGRAPGAEERGCSLAADIWIRGER